MADKSEAGSATSWLSRVDASLAREKTWRDKAKKVIRRYRDERGRSPTDSRINILWSNTEVLKAALFQRMPKADVRRRFTDAAKRNSASRTAAEVIERAIDYVVDVEKVEDAVSSAIDDHLLGGRGTVWVSYEPEVEEDEYEEEEGDTEAGLSGGGEPGGLYGDGGGVAAAGALGGSYGASGTLGGQPANAGQDQTYGAESGEQTEVGGRIVSQALCVDYVYWEDYCQGIARIDKDVPWKARRHTLRQGEVKNKWPNAKADKLASYELKDAEGEGDTSAMASGDDDENKLVEIWEVWDKTSKCRYWIARGYPDILQKDQDPYGLKCFYPAPRPIYSVMTTDKQQPVPEYSQYQDQARELDIICTRISRLLDQLRFRGIYDSVIDPEGNLKDLADADDGVFIPYEGWQALKDKGGIEAAIGFWPIEQIVMVLKELYVQRNTLVQAIYEITGISDIMRGSTDPGETKGAQVLKSRFGSMRQKKRQGEVQRFVKDIYNIIGEIVAEHFTQETLAEITQIDLPLVPEQPGAAGMQVPGAGPMPAPPMQSAPMGLPAPANAMSPSGLG